MINKDIEHGKMIEFENISKSFEYVRKLGVGGAGDTHLLKDNTTDMMFAFKKYNPKDEKHKKELYRRFVNEIKILFQLSHPNIVRIYNYYLYPKRETGYLQMEYIEGEPIDKYSTSSEKEWNDIFAQVISAFKYLEEKNILHRDIRPQNILIDKLGNVKIIDFGFGKMLNNKKEANSVLLNWPVSQFPEEVELNREYTYSTEIYFVGELFNYILNSKEIKVGSFNYDKIIKKMTEYYVKNRYSTFEEVYNDISSGIFNELKFTSEEMLIYSDFADALYHKISEYNSTYKPVKDIEMIIKNLSSILRRNSLETYIQNNAELIMCFINNTFSYYSATDILKEIVEKFYNWLVSLPEEKQVNVIENINTRLSNIKQKKEDEELPF